MRLRLFFAKIFRFLLNKVLFVLQKYALEITLIVMLFSVFFVILLQVDPFFKAWVTGRCPRCELFRIDLAGRVLKGANFEDAEIVGANLSYTNLENANLTSIDFGGTDLSGANLKNTKLMEASLSNANLDGTNLERANLRGSFLIRTQMRSANLKKANLKNVKLKLAGLENANFQGANFQGAKLEQIFFNHNTKWQGAIYDEQTVFPEGFDPVAKGMRFEPSDKK